MYFVCVRVCVCAHARARTHTCLGTTDALGNSFCITSLCLHLCVCVSLHVCFCFCSLCISHRSPCERTSVSLPVIVSVGSSSVPPSAGVSLVQGPSAASLGAPYTWTHMASAPNPSPPPQHPPVSTCVFLSLPPFRSLQSHIHPSQSLSAPEDFSLCPQTVWLRDGSACYRSTGPRPARSSLSSPRPFAGEAAALRACWLSHPMGHSVLSLIKRSPALSSLFPPQPGLRITPSPLFWYKPRVSFLSAKNSLSAAYQCWKQLCAWLQARPQCVCASLCPLPQWLWTFLCDSLCSVGLALLRNVGPPCQQV